MPVTNKADFARRLKEAREDCSFTQQYVADLMGMDVMRISKYERGVHVPGPLLIATLCEIYGVDHNYLFGFED